ncbi:MAG: formate--tetrahydrofolate ligase [Gemmatimonadota bacterium]|nr:MAG: formate--tetrahydrofolate ligase [Gemmatimonadota bacterium]
MKSDIEIAQAAHLKPIREVAASAGILEEEVILCGNHKAKISLNLLERLKSKGDGKLVVITAMTPTALGEGKTTTAVGLSMALTRLGISSIVTLREPSLGPVFGLKGGAAGGGSAQVLPMEEINLHFTGDMHAVTSAHNLVSAVIDNHIYQGNAMDIDPTQVVFPRAMDMNDRALRDIVVALGGTRHGIPREDAFIITAASEVMAVLSLSESLGELKERLGSIIVAFTRRGEPVTVEDLAIRGAVAALLKNALQPNLVQTVEHTPAFVHCGPFANIAHGTNSVVATKMALKLADVVVTETGFGSDLGAEKFFHIVAPRAGFRVHCVVIVASLRALKLHGGASKEQMGKTSIAALEMGLPNLLRHLENMNKFGVPTVVALNRFPGDSDEEVRFFTEYCSEKNIPSAVSEVFERGGPGGRELAHLVHERVKTSDGTFSKLYTSNIAVEEKINTIAREIYRAEDIVYQLQAKRDVRRIVDLGLDHLPVCMAKTPRSFSDDPKIYGAPEGFSVTIRKVSISAGAGFLVPIAGDIMLMPGLPKHPAAMDMDLDEGDMISGLF